MKKYLILSLIAVAGFGASKFFWSEPEEDWREIRAIDPALFPKTCDKPELPPNLKLKRK